MVLEESVDNSIYKITQVEGNKVYINNKFMTSSFLLCSDGMTPIQSKRFSLMSDHDKEIIQSWTLRF